MPAVLTTDELRAMRDQLAGGTAAPRWATKRTPGRLSFGPAIGAVAEALGKPLQEWQQLVADVATELVPDVEGRIIVDGRRYSWAYTTIVVHVQRQAGKTTLLGPKNLHRCLMTTGAKTWLTAQTRQDGRDTWKDVAELVSRSPLAGLVDVRRSNGSEELLVPGTGSTFRVFAPSEDALHGKANESVDVDEGWAFEHVQGLALQQAILPTFTTTGGQLWLTSTAGTAASTWLRSYVDRGRAAVEADQRTGIAYFEWSMPAAEAGAVTQVLDELARAGYKLDDQLRERLDLAVDLVLAFHPGRFVRRQAVLDAALTMPAGEFLRAYGNVWTMTSDRVVPDVAWRECRNPKLQLPEPGSLALAFDVSVDRSSAAIGAAWRGEAGRPAVDVVDARPGTSWLVDRLDELGKRWRVRELWADGAGPALDVVDELRRRGWTVHTTGTADYTAACAGWLSAVIAGQLQHPGRPALNEAVSNAARRELGDRWAWSRRQSAGSIDGLVAVTVALWAFDHKPEPAAAPVIVSRRKAEEPAQLPAARKRTLVA